MAVYGIFALAATARASVQLLTKFDQAPLAYLLSALAGLIYIVATITLARGTRASRRLALIAIIIELVGVITIGTLSVARPGGLSAGHGVVGVRDRLRLRSTGATDLGAGLAVAHPSALTRPITSVRAALTLTPINLQRQDRQARRRVARRRSRSAPATSRRQGAVLPT